MLTAAVVAITLAVAGQAMGQPGGGAARFWHFTVTGAAANGSKFTQVRAARLHLLSQRTSTNVQMFYQLRFARLCRLLHCHAALP